MRAQIVVGANFGDEGKGLFTDYLCSQSDNRIVVRHNGGAQAGHTVVTPDRGRHVFHHIGSGAFQEAPTMLASTFIVNPMLFNEEYDKLIEIGVRRPEVFVHIDALMSTPYDMILNILVEEQRGTNRHGSCGVGINETVVRNQHPQFRTTVGDWLSFNPLLREKLVKIRDEYLPLRCAELNIPIEKCDEWLSDDAVTWWINHCHLFMTRVYLHESHKVLSRYDNVIFEGAQGLLLDQNHRMFPHVTRSNTGSDNCRTILKEIGVDKAEVFYISRGYLTRHGAGPLPHAARGMLYDNIIDSTNIPNQFQGTMRFAPFNFDMIRESITDDLNRNREIQLIPNLVFTCFDQIPLSCIQIVENDIQESVANYDFLLRTYKICNFAKRHIFCGPTRNDKI